MRAKTGTGTALALLVVALLWGVSHCSPGPGGDDTLVAWAAPLWDSVRVANHTWVTTYESPTTCSPPNEDYWYCTGSCRDTTDPSIEVRELGHWSADVQLARCIAQPNVKSSKPVAANSGVVYGIDGVCHQIANRVLFAASDGGSPPTVEGAKFYPVTWLLYGTYGDVKRPWQWIRLLRDCSAGDRMAVSEDDVFATWIEAQLGERGEQFAERLVNLRTEIRAEKEALDLEVVSGRINGEEFANRINQLATTRIREMLGDEDYERLFDVRANEEIVICDPRIAAEIDYQSVRLEE